MMQRCIQEIPLLASGGSFLPFSSFSHSENDQDGGDDDDDHDQNPDKE